MRIIVGQESGEKLAKYAESIGGQVFYDEDGSYYRAMGGGGVPQWIVTNSEREELERFAGGVAGAPMEKLVDAMIDERLGLSDYL